MFPLKTRVEAFTILELVVGMALSAILFSMAYLALRLVQQRESATLQSARQLNQVASLQALLEQDFHAATQVQALDADRLRCQFSNHTVEYELLDSAIVRRHLEASDSFALQAVEHHWYYKGVPAQNSNGLVDEAILTVVSARDTFDIQAAAHLDAQHRMTNTFLPSSTL